MRSSCISIIQCYIGYLVQCAGMMCRAKSCALTAHELVEGALSLSFSCVPTERSGSPVVASMCTCRTCVHVVRIHVYAIVL